MSSLLLIGKTGQVGHELEQTLRRSGSLTAPDRAALDLTDPDAIRNFIRETRPAVIVNAAGFTIVDDAESRAGLAMQLNAVAPGIIAECAAEVGAVLIHFSTIFAFDGAKREPYTEDDTPNPINTYGRSKLAGERAVAEMCPHHLILRANWVYSARRTNFALTMIRCARAQQNLSVVNDQFGSPTWARDYAGAVAFLLQDIQRLRDNPGMYHLSAEGHCSRLQWAEKLIDSAKAASGLNQGWARLHPTTTAQYPLQAPRPLYTVSSNRKIAEAFGLRMPSWEDRVDTFVRTLLPELITQQPQ